MSVAESSFGRSTTCRAARRRRRGVVAAVGVAAATLISVGDAVRAEPVDATKANSAIGPAVPVAKTAPLTTKAPSTKATTSGTVVVSSSNAKALSTLVPASPSASSSNAKALSTMVPASPAVLPPLIERSRSTTVVASPALNVPANLTVKAVAAKPATMARTQTQRLAPADKPAKNVIPGKVATTWSVQIPLTGWERLRNMDWPISGEALGAVGRKTSLDVRRGPSVGEPGLRFSKGRSSTGPVTLLVVQDFGDWIQVAVPVRPNGTVGWVRSSDIQRINLAFRVVVELSTNTMIVERAGQELYRESVASGTGNTPTPTGLFFVREVVKEAENGPYGPYVFGLSGYSDVLVSFQGGEGAIGIHGTDSPGLIGSNASFGCIRIANSSIRNLVRLIPLGTPVEIVRTLSDLPTVRRSRGTPDPEPYADTISEEITEEITEFEPGTDINDAPTYNAEAIDFIDTQNPPRVESAPAPRPGGPT